MRTFMASPVLTVASLLVVLTACSDSPTGGGASVPAERRRVYDAVNLNGSIAADIPHRLPVTLGTVYDIHGQIALSAAQVSAYPEVGRYVSRAVVFRALADSARKLTMVSPYFPVSDDPMASGDWVNAWEAASLDSAYAADTAAFPLPSGDFDVQVTQLASAMMASYSDGGGSSCAGAKARLNTAQRNYSTAIRGYMQRVRHVLSDGVLTRGESQDLAYREARIERLEYEMERAIDAVEAEC